MAASGALRRAALGARPMQSRSLTTGEVEMARSVFGSAIDYGRVRLIEGKWWPLQPRRSAMAPMGDIWFHPDGAGWSERMTEHVAVVGAGVFGAWTAVHLQRAGHRVTLIDAWAPAHSRASSGGESRLTRGAYGKDSVYTRMAMNSLPEWQALSAQ